MSLPTCCWCHAPLVQAQGAWWCGGSQACRTRQTTFASAHTDRRTGAVKTWLYVPTPVQTVWHEATLVRTTKNLCVGGAAGPGKSKFGRESLYWLARQVPGCHALLLRRTHKDLDQSHIRFMPFELEQRGGKWMTGDRIGVFKHKGQPDSIIRAGHMETSADVQNYLSSEYDVIFPDELVTFERDPMLELFTRARSTNPALFALRGLDDPDPAKRLDGALVLAATNPGGRGALWVRDFFVHHDVDAEAFPSYRPERWAFHGARLEDNPYMAAGYRETLEMMPELRRRQLLDGDWTAFEGQFFGEWRPTVNGQPWHVRRLDAGSLSGCQHFASMDWGFNAPGVVLWWVVLPDGELHIRREYKFQQQTGEAVGAQIHAITKELGCRLAYLAADPAMWAKTGNHTRGESIAETLQRMQLPMRKADNDRFNGAMRVHELLRTKPDGTGPWLTVDPSCTYLLRTLPTLVQDAHNPDDVDTTKDDHAYDALRYGAQSRPSPLRALEQKAVGGVGRLMADVLAGQRQSVLGSESVRVAR